MKILTIAIYGATYGLGIEVRLSRWGIPYMTLKPVQVVPEEDLL